MLRDRAGTRFQFEAVARDVAHASACRVEFTRRTSRGINCCIVLLRLAYKNSAAIFARSLIVLLFSTALLAQQPRDIRLQAVAPANPLGDRGSRWALVVGISDHHYLPPPAQLHFAHRDAEEFAAFLRSAPGGALPSDHIRLLSNERATLAAIRAALHTWLVESAGPDDIVYLFFAGHGVVAESDEAYLVAHDSDPQNLHATALSFREVDRTLSERLRANLIVMTLDACHSGQLGWTSFTVGSASRANEPIAAVGRADRSFLKLLASRPSESSFEDERWNGGHGVFTHTMLEGLRGPADRDNDGVVRASELIDYLARRVPEQTQARQHPRVAGTFDARMPLSIVPPRPPPPPESATLDVSGPAGAGVYIDHVFRGILRRDGGLRVEALPIGAHRLSADLLEGVTLEGSFTMPAAPSRIELAKPGMSALARLQSLIAAGQVLEPGGAVDFFRAQPFSAAQRPAALALLTAAVEEAGQACVQDYVQSTQVGLKKVMLRRGAEAFARLQLLRPYDTAIEARKLFCQGRLQVAEGQFASAVATLQESIRRDPQFACAYNALGVALERLNQPGESRRAFETAAKLTPEWALPPFQIASQHIARGEFRQALPYLENAVRFNPRSISNRWTLMKVHRLLGRLPEVETDAAALAKLNPNYAPAYLELGRAYESAGTFAKAAEAFETYLLLAPNFADSDEIRARARRFRSFSARPTPSLRKP